MSAERYSDERYSDMQEYLADENERLERDWHQSNQEIQRLKLRIINLRRTLHDIIDLRGRCHYTAIGETARKALEEDGKHE